MASRNEVFSKRFNERLGNYTGSKAQVRTQQPSTKEQFLEGTRSSADATLVKKALGKSRGSAKKKKTVKDSGPKKEKQLVDSPENVEAAERGFGTHSFGNSFFDRVKGGLGSAFAAGPLGPPAALGAAIYGALKPDDPKVERVTGFEGNLIGRAGDLASRPLYALNEGARRTIENQGEGTLNPLEYLGDATRGAGQGLWGTKKTSGADVRMELIKQSDQMPGWMQVLSDPFNSYENMKETLEDPNADLKKKQRIAQWVGATGLVSDIAADPFNFVGFFAKPGAVLRAVDEAGNVINEVDNAGNVIKTADGISAVRYATDRAVTSALRDADIPLKGWTTNGTAMTRDKSLRTFLQEVVSKTTNEIGGGTKEGKVLGSDKFFTSTIASQASTQYRNLALERITEAMETWIKRMQSGKPLTAKEIQTLRKKDPLAEVFFKTLNEELAVSDWAKATNMTEMQNLFSKAADTAMNAVRNTVDDSARKFRSKVFDQLDNNFFSQPVLRTMNGKTINMGPGSFWKHSTGANPFKAGPKALSFYENFPGLTNEYLQKARAGGIRDFEVNWRPRVLEAFDGMTDSQLDEIHKALKYGYELSGPEEIARKNARQIYDDMAKFEEEMGIRPATWSETKNYVYEYAKGDTTSKGNWKALRTKLLREGHEDWATILENSPEAKKIKGLRTTNARDALLQRAVKLERDWIRKDYLLQAINMYGHKTAGKLSAAELTDLGLKKLDESILPVEVRKMLKKSTLGDEHWYLPKEVDDTLKFMQSAFSFRGDAATHDIVNKLDELTRFFKTQATVYYPGFHIRNALGDAIMGSMDGVGISDYRQTFKLNQAMNAGETPIIKLGGTEVPYSRLYGSFEGTAQTGGFMNTELDSLDDLTKVPNRVNAFIRRKSEQREDFMRMAHFKHAMEEEYPAALKRYKNEAQAWQKAVDASTYRVNKYHVDYGALTPFEAKFLKRVVPFYTFQRRIMPTLIESLFLKPQYLTIKDKFYNNLFMEGRSPVEFPQWMRDIAWTPFTGGDNPWGVAIENVLPTNVMRPYMTTDPKELTRAIGAQANPLISAPIEVMTGQDLYSGRPVGGYGQSIADSLRPLSFTQTLLGRNLNPFGDRPFGSKIAGKAWQEKVLQTVGGLPIYKLTDNRLEGARYANNQKIYALADEISSYLLPKGMKMYVTNLSDGQRIRVATVKLDDSGNPRVDKVIFQTQDVQTALDYAEELLANGS
jgi:hypothetical protein